MFLLFLLKTLIVSIRYKKIRPTPVNPSFIYIKVGYKRVYITPTFCSDVSYFFAQTFSWTCYPDALVCSRFRIHRAVRNWQ